MGRRGPLGWPVYLSILVIACAEDHSTGAQDGGARDVGTGGRGTGGLGTAANRGAGGSSQVDASTGAVGGAAGGSQQGTSGSGSGSGGMGPECLPSRWPKARFANQDWPQ